MYEKRVPTKYWPNISGFSHLCSLRSPCDITGSQDFFIGVHDCHTGIRKMIAKASEIVFIMNQSNINSLRLKQNKRHFADDVFKCNFLNENVWILTKISLQFVPKGPFNNIPALVQIMARRWTGDRPLSEPMMTQFNDAYMHYLASMS